MKEQFLKMLGDENVFIVKRVKLRECNRGDAVWIAGQWMTFNYANLEKRYWHIVVTEHIPDGESTLDHQFTIRQDSPYILVKA
ncbi:TPA: hypothetical protein N3288_000229 [Klebsiella aerogenes]|nr:hypothetical protein [Klebsiella aerogenes]